MIALAVITLFITAFTIIYYSYLSNVSERDVSFFLSVSLISMFMNLCTNTGGLYGFSVVYLIIAALFIGFGFLVDLENTLAFYKSIGPWFKNTFTEKKVIGWKALSFVVFPVGIALYFMDYKDRPAAAKVWGRAAIFGILLWVLLLWMILGLVL